MFWLLVIVIQWQMLDTQNSFLKDNSGKGEGQFHQDHPQANPLHRVSSMISECKPVNKQNHRVMKWINMVVFFVVGGSINIVYQTQTDLCTIITTIKMQNSGICKSRLLFRYIWPYMFKTRCQSQIRRPVMRVLKTGLSSILSPTIENKKLKRVNILGFTYIQAISYLNLNICRDYN